MLGTPCRKLLNNIVGIERCYIRLNYYLLFTTKYPQTIVSAHAYAINVNRYLFIYNKYTLNKSNSIKPQYKIKYVYILLCIMHILCMMFIVFNY